jgi:serine/threonine-protein kinase
MAEVFLAEASSGELVAVKIAHASTAENLAERALFVAEAEAARDVVHPRLVRCLATTRSPLAMVLTYVDGPSLAALVEAGPLPSPVHAVALVRDVAEGLVALHAAGRTHGDLCPRNILVRSDGRASSSDFGAADAAPSDRPFLGTFGYFAPEIARGARGNTASDWFSLGVVLWELLRGQPLFAAPGTSEATRLVRAAEEIAAPVDDDRAELSPFASLCRSLLAPDPAARAVDGPEIVKQLSLLCEGAPAPSLRAHVERVFAREHARRESARNAVAARNRDG